MDTSINFEVRLHHRLRREDFPNLPDELQKRFDTLFLRVLAVDPYNRRGFSGHSLDRELSGFDTIDVKHLGEAYRVVYRIDDDPEVMRVTVYSFDRHDPAYEKARNRALGWR